MKTFEYTVEGTDGAGNSYTVQGHVAGDAIFDPEVYRAVGLDSFNKLTSGKAVYGRPGEGGCRGPYKIDRVKIEAKS